VGEPTVYERWQELGEAAAKVQPTARRSRGAPTILVPSLERGVEIMRQVDLLEPVDLPGRLARLELYLSQVCAVAGITKMQLDYWTTKGDIPTKGKKQRVYDMDAVETVMLIKQAKDKGLNLGAAIAAAREFQARAGEKRSIAS
jgi:hypothetical protein